jgi:hypothetical protein
MVLAHLVWMESEWENMMDFVIRGVHPVETLQPFHLVEVELRDADAFFDWAAVTQEVPGEPQSNWQVPWDERPISSDSTRWVFFFHHLNLNSPLLTPYGPVDVPAATPRPDHLSDIEYESPC